MEKNTVWAIVLSTIVLVGFFLMQTFMFPNKKNLSAKSNKNDNYEEKSEDSAYGTMLNGNDTFLVTPRSTNNQSEKNYVISTEKVKVTFTNFGGDIIGYELLAHKDIDTGKGIEMADNITKNNRAFSIAFGSKKEFINDIFNVKILDDYTIGFFNDYSVINNDGSISNFTFGKKYSFKKDDYVFKLDITVNGDENFNGFNEPGIAYSIKTSPQIGPFYNPKMNRYENRQIISYNGEKRKRIIIGTNQTKTYDKLWIWTAVAGKYFEILAFPEDISKINNVVEYTSKSENDKINSQLFISRNASSENSFNDTYYFYVGPRNEKELSIYNIAEKNSWNLNNAHFNESLQTSGFLSWLEFILKFFLELINKVVRNWGVSIIILTMLLKMVMFPITAKTAKGTLKMQELQPKMTAIQEKYKDNPKKLQEQTAKLYKEGGYNPMSGCLPLIVQFVILFAMYNLFNNYFEFRGAMFIPGWIPDLSSGDHVATLNFNIPFLGNHIRILPVIYLISQLLFGKITQNGGTSAGQNQGQMKIMMYGMPILFFFLFYNAPSGLLIYWTVSNAMQLGQQLVINKVVKKN